MGLIRPAACMLLAALLAACGAGERIPPDQAGVVKIGPPYAIKGRWYRPAYQPDYDEVGVASWYGDYFHGRDTANGETFDKDEISAAHKTLPLPSIVEVTNLENGRAMQIRVNDRGPFVDDRIIDLSEGAARELGFHEDGLARVRVRFVRLDGELRVADSGKRARRLPAVEPSPARPQDAEPQVEPESGTIRVAELPDAAPPATLEPAPALQPAPAPVAAPRRVAAPAELPAQRPTRAQAPVHLACDAGPGPLFVQVGAFTKPSSAEAVRRALGSEPVQIQPVFKGGAAMARLRAGPYATVVAAADVLARVKAMGHDEAFVSRGAQSLRPACRSDA